MRASVIVLALVMALAAGIAAAESEVVVAAAIVVAEGAEKWSYEGELNPNTFDTWQIVRAWPCFSGYPHYHEIIKNPDESSPIKYVEMLLTIHDTGVHLFRYSYMKDGESFVYEVDTKNKRYVRVRPEGKKVEVDDL